MRTYFKLMLFMAAAFTLATAGHAAAGNISGTISVKGLRSPADVLVFLTKAPETGMNLSAAKFVMDQKDLAFLPHVLPVPVGATVSFPNNDKVDHNVFSISRTKPFNLGSYKPGQSKGVVFDKPGIVELRCDVHAEMLAYIVVLKNPYFAVTDPDGGFNIPDAVYWKKMGIKGPAELPAGDYTMKSWHKKLKNKKHSVTVPETGASNIQLSLTRGKAGVLYK